MTAIPASLLACISTTIGGLFALRFRDRLHLVLGFTAGVLLGTVSFDILPEVFERAHQQGMDARLPMIALVAGFLLFHGLEKFLLVHHIHEADYAAHHHPHVGLASAFALVGHSFLDGVGIGLAFQVSVPVGVSVALAVITHDFCDGLNTVSLMLVHRNSTRRSLVMLALDAIAPVGGALAATLIRPDPAGLALYLGFFGGFLLYIGVSDVLPEAHSNARLATSLVLIGLTTCGAAVMYLTIRLLA